MYYQRVVLYRTAATVDMLEPCHADGSVCSLSSPRSAEECGQGGRAPAPRVHRRLPAPGRLPGPARRGQRPRRPTAPQLRPLPARHVRRHGSLRRRTTIRPVRRRRRRRVDIDWCVATARNTFGKKRAVVAFVLSFCNLHIAFVLRLRDETLP